MAGHRAPGEFSAEEVRRLMTKACAHVGLDSSGARLIRLGENAIFSLPSPKVVVRIARSINILADVEKEVGVARWLREEAYPAVRLADVAAHEQPFIIDGHPVTLWCLVETTPPQPSPGDLGRLLRSLHGLQPPAWLALPEFQPFGRVERRLDTASTSVDSQDVAFLRQRLDDLRVEYEGLTFVFPPGPVHGDAHPGNLLRTAKGDVVLMDFEAFCHGQREWDLSLAAAYRQAFGWFSEANYQSFVESYGYDIAAWPGVAVLRSIRELGMTTWLMQMVDDDHAKAEEFRRRVDDIRHDRFPRGWKPF